MTFSERLETLLKDKRVTWKKVSTELHIGRNQKKYWEDNGIVPGMETLLKLATYFAVSLDYLRGTDVLKEKAINTLDNQILTLSPQEVHLILKYRKLDDEGRIMVDSALISELRRITENKREENTSHIG